MAAQVTAGLLNRHTTFNSFSAAMLASAYRHLTRGQYTMFAIDSALTVLNLEHQRGLVYSAMAAGLMRTLNLPNPNWPGAQFINANTLLPLILAANLTEDSLSMVITAAGLLLNQYLLYQPRALFLDRGHGIADIEPYWSGVVGLSLMSALALVVHWRDMPDTEQITEAVSHFGAALSRWLNYLVFLEESPDHPDQNNSWTAWLQQQYSAWTREPESTDEQPEQEQQTGY